MIDLLVHPGERVEPVLAEGLIRRRVDQEQPDHDERRRHEQQDRIEMADRPALLGADVRPATRSISPATPRSPGRSRVEVVQPLDHVPHDRRGGRRAEPALLDHRDHHVPRARYAGTIAANHEVSWKRRTLRGAGLAGHRDRAEREPGEGQPSGSAGLGHLCQRRPARCSRAVLGCTGGPRSIGTRSASRCCPARPRCGPRGAAGTSSLRSRGRGTRSRAAAGSHASRRTRSIEQDVHRRGSGRPDRAPGDRSMNFASGTVPLVSSGRSTPVGLPNPSCRRSRLEAARCSRRAGDRRQSKKNFVPKS